MDGIPVAKLYEDKGEALKLEILTASLESKRQITVSDVNRPGLAFAGFLENFLDERIQILGQTELLYLSTLSPKRRKEGIGRIVTFSLPCIIVCKGLDVPAELIEAANTHSIPIMRTPLSTTPFIHELSAYLDVVFASRTVVHGSLVDVYGVGLLFTGRSSIGKSECALDLVERGHRLVADDVVNITRRHGNFLIGSSSEILRHRIEIRGLGIIDVRSIFGIRSVRLQKRIEVEVRLREWNEGEDYERVGLDDRMTQILDVDLPMVTIPIVPGKNITVIAEVIALNHVVKVYGYHPARDFDEKLMQAMHRRSLEDRLVRDDWE
ncbi:MAG: HPr(Ser) kinase/phosphatase [Candidatus Eisenbacteria bacterium]